MDEFESLLKAERLSVERFVRFRLNFRADADDVLRDVYLTAYRRFALLKNKESFKAWIISIARNRKNDAPFDEKRSDIRGYPTFLTFSNAIKI